MKRFFVTTIDSEYDTLKKATVNVRSYTRRGKIVQAYTQQRLMREDATKLLGRMKRTGGFSWRAWGGEHEPKTGFMVGAKHGPIVASENTLDLFAWLKKERAVREDPNKFFGGWIDKKTGKIHLDISLNMANKQEALDKGKQRGEISIWDVVKQKEIRIY